MTKKIECKILYPNERNEYPDWYTKTELKKMKLMPKKNVKPVALVIQKYYDNYNLYDIEKTTEFKLTTREKKELNKKRKKLAEKKKVELEKSTCKNCHELMSKDEKVGDYICQKCYKEIYNKNKDEYINNLMNKKIICIDVETTGLENDDEILQISIINQNGDILLNEFCKPENKTVWLEAMSINGITPEQVKNCKQYSFYKDKVQSFIDEYDVIIGYNVSFDLNFLRCDYNNKKIIDVMKYFAHVYGEWNNYNSYTWQKLVECAEYYNYSFNAHDSLEDVKATLYCYPKVMYDYNFNIYDYL